MSKNISASILVMIAATLTGCDDKARELVKQTDLVLKQRSTELRKKTLSEVNAYKAYASLATEDQRDMMASRLNNERSERTDRISAEFLADKSKISLWRSELAKYASVDFDAQRQLLTTDLDATNLYLQRYEDISIQQDKVDALDKLLISLSKEPSFKDQVSSITSFAQDTKDAFDKDMCEDLKKKKGDSDDAAKAADKLYTAKKCDDVLKK